MSEINPFDPHPYPKLTIELIPFGQWFDNVRAKLSQAQWDQLKKACYVKASHRCEICAGVGKKHPVECHEIWHYDDLSQVQTLQGLIALCPSCHRVKHIGNANRMGLLAPTLKHLAKINQWPMYMAEAYFEVSMDQWAYRSQFAWTLNLDWLDNAQAYLESAETDAREARKTRAESVLSRMRDQRSASSRTTR